MSGSRPGRGAAWSRRELLAFGWLPFFRRKHISLAGARFRILRNGRDQRHFLTIHGNEETARAVLTRFMETQEGTAYIVESRTRNVPVDSGEMDPNRMFSRVGAEANLKSLNPGWTEDQLEHALRVLDRGREHLLRSLLPPDRRLIFALHNNSENYSVADEAPVSDATSLRQPGNPHAFFLCTDPADYAILSQSGYNVVLQHEKPGADDGSLSHLCAQRNVRYLNLETRLGDADRQLEMLRWAHWSLP